MLKFHSYDLRTQFIKLGFVAGKKSYICKPPNKNYDEISFWRGVIDGDGSIGFTAENIPFISLATQSKYIAKAFKIFVENITNFYPTTSKNKRDRTWNITIWSTNAIKLAKVLYPKNAISMTRKRKLAKKLSII
jgi:hypothetical protein